MRLLTYQARRFAWTPHSPGRAHQTADGGPAATAEAAPPAGEVTEAVVAWLHVEAADAADEARALRKTAKHIKWVANKRQMKAVALHVFAHLGGDSAEPAFARAFIGRLAERLRGAGYAVETTPFGWFCAWELDVYGESLAKVFKQF